MRKMITREVTSTTIKLGKMELVDGEVKAVTLPDLEVFGNVNLERANRIVSKKYDEPLTVLQVIPKVVTYEMPLDDFVANATIKEK